MSNNSFGYKECQDPLATIPRICNPSAMSNGRGPAAEGVAHMIATQYTIHFNNKGAKASKILTPGSPW